uniref:Probable ribosome biogenesis protein RLP24 n=1 Tax=Tanacetum cinerariifolium TaxID=118510 RepID=A0A699J7H6_TANCI|nr:probable ribosome biogenesis protein RLP24 [Tanacetum cinerariifolium]
MRNDAKTFRFCQSKSHDNLKIKKNLGKVKLTKSYRRLDSKDMTQDATFKIEKKRNVPERYDINLTENTLKGIKTIDKLRSRKEETHLKNRNKLRHNISDVLMFFEVKKTWWYQVESETLTREDVVSRFFDCLLQASNLGESRRIAPISSSDVTSTRPKHVVDFKLFMKIHFKQLPTKGLEAKASTSMAS